MPDAASDRRPFPRELLAEDTLAAARALLGARLVRDPDPWATGAAGGRREGRIVEVEAYIGEADRASHARFGRTARNRVMFGGPGVAYVYLVYGMHHCLNVVTEQAGHPAAVLIRAVEPVVGVDAMRAARVTAIGRARRDPAAGALAIRRLAAVPDVRLAAGPGLVGSAFSLDRSHTGVDLCAGTSVVRLERSPVGELEPDVTATRRVGVDYAGEPWARLAWRFLVPGCPAVSTARRSGHHA